MRVLLTGGTGFVGSHTAGALQRSRHTIRVLARDPSRVPLVLGPLGLETDEIAIGNITVPASVEAALDDCDAVVHCPAQLGIGRSHTGTVNVDGARTVVGCALERGIDPIVYLSSITVHLPSLPRRSQCTFRAPIRSSRRQAHWLGRSEPTVPRRPPSTGSSKTSKPTEPR